MVSQSAVFDILIKPYQQIIRCCFYVASVTDIVFYESILFSCHKDGIYVIALPQIPIYRSIPLIIRRVFRVAKSSMKASVPPCARPSFAVPGRGSLSYQLHPHRDVRPKKPLFHMSDLCDCFVMKKCYNKCTDSKKQSAGSCCPTDRGFLAFYGQRRRSIDAAWLEKGSGAFDRADAGRACLRVRGKDHGGGRYRRVGKHCPGIPVRYRGGSGDGRTGL